MGSELKTMIHNYLIEMSERGDGDAKILLKMLEEEQAAEE